MSRMLDPRFVAIPCGAPVLPETPDDAEWRSSAASCQIAVLSLAMVRSAETQLVPEFVAAAMRSIDDVMVLHVCPCHATRSFAAPPRACVGRVPLAMRHRARVVPDLDVVLQERKQAQP